MLIIYPSYFCTPFDFFFFDWEQPHWHIYGSSIKLQNDCLKSPVLHFYHYMLYFCLFFKFWKHYYCAVYYWNAGRFYFIVFVLALLQRRTGISEAQWTHTADLIMSRLGNLGCRDVREQDKQSHTWIFMVFQSMKQLPNITADIAVFTQRCDCTSQCGLCVNTTIDTVNQQLLPSAVLWSYHAQCLNPCSSHPKDCAPNQVAFQKYSHFDGWRGKIKYKHKGY